MSDRLAGKNTCRRFKPIDHTENTKFHDSDVIQVIGLTAEVKHILNPLHIYCRLRDMGLGRRPAAFLCRLYERVIFRKCFPVY